MLHTLDRRNDLSSWLYVYAVLSSSIFFEPTIVFSRFFLWSAFAWFAISFHLIYAFEQSTVNIRGWDFSNHWHVKRAFLRLDRKPHTIIRAFILGLSSHGPLWPYISNSESYSSGWKRQKNSMPVTCIFLFSNCWFCCVDLWSHDFWSEWYIYNL